MGRLKQDKHKREVARGWKGAVVSCFTSDSSEAVSLRVRGVIANFVESLQMGFEKVIQVGLSLPHVRSNVHSYSSLERVLLDRARRKGNLMSVLLININAGNYAGH